MVSNKRTRLAKIHAQITQLEKATQELKALGQGIPVIEKNAGSILAIVALLKYGISDVVETDH